MLRPIRSIDLKVPLLLAAGVLIAASPLTLVRERSIQVPVTGTIVNPCSAEEIVFGGTADVRLRSTRSGDGGFRVEVQADLADAVATSSSGTEFDMRGVASGEGETYGPFPVTLELDGRGILVNDTSAENFSAGTRFQISVEEEGSAAPTGSVEVTALECQS